MNFVFNVLLVSSFVAFVSAACDVCACNAPPPVFTEEIFDELIKESGVEIRTFVQANSAKVENCQIVIDCTFSLTNEYDEGRRVAVTNDDVSQASQPYGVTCSSDSRWVYEGKNVTYIGCYLAQERELE